MLVSDIIKKFETYVDDSTELSSQDELDLLNKVYRDVWTDRPWEFAKKEYSNTISGTSKALPTDFAYICDTGDSFTPLKRVYVGNSEYRVVNFSDRRTYQNRSGYCWVDMVNQLLVFSGSVSGTLTYDYVFFPVDLTIVDTPLFPSTFHDVLYHLMAVDDYAIQQFDKARSYAPENQKKADYWLSKMAMWNANLVINNNE